MRGWAAARGSEPSGEVAPEGARCSLSLSSDPLSIARYLLYRIGEKYNTAVTLDPKPVRGDWNGACAHTSFSTKRMREPGGIAAIHAAMPRLEERHALHIKSYGDGIERRLTGLHETCSFREFGFGVGHRGDGDAVVIEHRHGADRAVVRVPTRYTP